MRSDDNVVQGIVVAAIIVIIVSVIGLQCNSVYSGRNKTIAIDEAKAWANEIGLKYKGVTCSDRDSDNDGYISCTVLPEVGDIVNVECAAAYTIASGCRSPKFSVKK